MKKWAVFFLFVTLSSCKMVDIYAPADSVLTLASDKTILRAGGDRAKITITGISKDGAPLQDHTVVWLGATLGEITEKVELLGGWAEAEFISGADSGEAEISAHSGAIEANKLKIAIGNAALAKLIMYVNPASFPEAGGSSRIKVYAYDKNGNLLAGIQIALTATTGKFLSGGGMQTTDNQGMIQAVLHVTKTSTVRAEGGSAVYVEKTITVETSSLFMPDSQVHWP